MENLLHGFDILCQLQLVSSLRQEELCHVIDIVSAEFIRQNAALQAVAADKAATTVYSGPVFQILVQITVFIAFHFIKMQIQLTVFLCHHVDKLLVGQILFNLFKTIINYLDNIFL